MQDFYASDFENREPYFDRLASQLLRGARDLANAEQILSGVAELASVESGTETVATPVPDRDFALNLSRIEEELQQFDELLQRSASSGLQAEPNGIEFRATFSEVLNVDAFDARAFPTGIAAIAVESSENVQPLLRCRGGGCLSSRAPLQ